MIFSKKSAAEKLGISEKSLERLVIAGLISCHRIGRRVLFDEDDLSDFWTSCRQPIRNPFEKCETRFDTTVQ